MYLSTCTLHGDFALKECKTDQSLTENTLTMNFFKHAVWQVSFKSTWFVFLKKVSSTSDPWGECKNGMNPSSVEMSCQRDYILGFIPTSLSVERRSTQMLQLHLAVPPSPPTRPCSLQWWPRQRHESGVGLQSCDSHVDRHWTGHAGGCRGSALHVHAAVFHALADVHIILCYVDVSVADFFYCCLQDCIMTLFTCQLSHYIAEMQHEVNGSPWPIF